jgi:hypothetical protein
MKHKTVVEMLESIDVGLLDMNIMSAMKMLHDNSYSDREKEYLSEFADIPFSEEEEEGEDDPPEA